MVWRRFLALAAVLTLSALLSGCSYTLQALKGTDGKTLAYAAVGVDGAPNSGIIVSSIGAIVIDPPLNPEMGQQLNADALRRSKQFWDEMYKGRKETAEYQAPPVLYVLNTTYRASHTFGNQAFTAADVITTHAAAKRLSSMDEVQRMREVLRSQFKVPGMSEHAMTQPHLSFEGSLSIRTPEIEIRMLSMGDCVGEGDCVVYLPQQKTLFAGDLVVPSFVPYPGGRTPTIGNWIAALNRLKALDLDTIVPGHGSKLGGKELIDQQLEFLTILRAETLAAKNSGMTLQQAQAAVPGKLVKFNNWRGFNEWIGENVKLVYTELSSGPTGALKPESVNAGVAQPRAVDNNDPFRDK